MDRKRKATRNRGNSIRAHAAGSKRGNITTEASVAGYAGALTQPSPRPSAEEKTNPGGSFDFGRFFTEIGDFIVHGLDRIYYGDASDFSLACQNLAEGTFLKLWWQAVRAELSRVGFATEDEAWENHVAQIGKKPLLCALHFLDAMQDWRGEIKAILFQD